MVDGREPSRDRCLRPSEPSWPSPQEQIIECAPWCARSGVLPQTEGGGEKGTLIASQDDEAGGIDSAAVHELIRRLLP